MKTCKLNGVRLSKYVVVSDNGAAAMSLCSGIFEKYRVKLCAVGEGMAIDAPTIKIGSFGCDSYGGYRYCVGSRDGDIFIDGETKSLQEAAVAFLLTRILGEGGELTVPELRYGYRWFKEKEANTDTLFVETTAERELARGVKYYEKKYINNEGKNANVFFTVVSGDTETEFRVWAGDMAALGTKRQMTVKTVTEQAIDFEAVKGEAVVSAVNASYFRMFDGGSNYPYGLRVLDGEVLCEPMIILDWKPWMRPDLWIGLTYEGKLVWGDKVSYEAEYRGKIKYGVAVGCPMMRNGKIEFMRKSGVDPLTGIAMTADGGYALVCVDGRTEESAGCTTADVLGMFLDLEADIPDIKFENVFILDGGGSTEMVLKEDGNFVTKNIPSTFVDGVSVSRPVGDIIAVTIP